jgi:hypothetical protein
VITDPAKATRRQKIAAAAVLAATAVVPFLCWLAIDHEPWQRFLGITTAFSAVAWFIGGVILGFVFDAPWRPGPSRNKGTEED